MDNYLTSAVVWSFVWVAIGLVLTLGASLLSARTLFPDFSERCAESCSRPLRAGLLGLVSTVIAGVLIHVFQGLGPPGQGLVLLTAGMVILLALAGASGLIVRMARRSVRAGETPDSWPALLRATITLTLTWLLPVAGWFIILPASLLCGLGCALQNLRAPRSAGVPALSSADPAV